MKASLHLACDCFVPHRVNSDAVVGMQVPRGYDFIHQTAQPIEIASLIAAAIKSTSLQPSTTNASLALSLYLRYNSSDGD
jgi:hypothetical protein